MVASIGVNICLAIVNEMLTRSELFYNFTKMLFEFGCLVFFSKIYTIAILGIGPLKECVVILLQVLFFINTRVYASLEWNGYNLAIPSPRIGK